MSTPAAKDGSVKMRAWAIWIQDEGGYYGDPPVLLPDKESAESTCSAGEVPVQVFLEITRLPKKSWV